jgi:hypothetical protein
MSGAVAPPAFFEGPDQHPGPKIESPHFIVTKAQFLNGAWLPVAACGSIRRSNDMRFGEEPE